MEERIRIQKEKNKNKVWKELKTSIRPTKSLENLLKRMGIKLNCPKENIPGEKLEELKLIIKNKEIQGTRYGKKKHEEMKKENIQKLIKINATRGRRLKSGYPAKGQRTRTNAKTAKKNKV